MSDWLSGFGSNLPSITPTVIRTTPRSASQPSPIQCPACGSKDVKVRSSTRIVAYLLCLKCGHEWKYAGKVERVLMPV